MLANPRLAGLFVFVVLVIQWYGGQVHGQPPRAASTKSRGWTLEEAIDQLRLTPAATPTCNTSRCNWRNKRGTIARFATRSFEPCVATWAPATLRGRRPRHLQRFARRAGEPATRSDVQLQPDSQRGSANGRAHGQSTGCQVGGAEDTEYPWEKLLAGRKPEISPLTRYVPSDFYFAEFRSLSKMLDLIDQGDLWGRHLFSQASQEARTQRVGERLRRQLAVESSPLARPFYDRVVAEVAVTGSDLYVREGSDVTLVFRHRSKDVFQTQMNLYLTGERNLAPTPCARRSDIWASRSCM